MRPRLILRSINALRAGRIGDAGACKAAALSAPAYADVERKVLELNEPFPQFDVERLAQLPSGTFGRIYADFMAANNLRSLVMSDDVKREVASINPVAVRYTLVHDAFHVLLGFDTTLPGELGVWTFVGEQRYSPSFARAATCARFLYPIAAPSLWSELKQARERACEIARQVPCLIARPVEHYWALPLTVAREKLGITIN